MISSSKINNYNTVSGFNSSKLHVNIQRNQPLLFKFKISMSQQTPLGIYTIPLIATREPSIATTTKSLNSQDRVISPEFDLS